LVALSAALTDADDRRKPDGAVASLGDVERVRFHAVARCYRHLLYILQVSRAVESMRLRLDSDARAIAALEQAAASNGDGVKDIKSQLLQVLRKVDSHDKKMSGFEGKVRWIEEHSSSTYSSPISSGISSPAMLKAFEKQRAQHSSESLKDNEQMRAQVNRCMNCAWHHLSLDDCSCARLKVSFRPWTPNFGILLCVSPKMTIQM
jgi:hypothetical protein